MHIVPTVSLKRLSAALLVVLLAAVLPGRGPSLADAPPSGAWVTVHPSVGSHRRSLRIFFTSDEITVVAAMAPEVKDARRGTLAVVNPGDFHVEPSARKSQLLATQRRVLSELQRIFEKYNGVLEEWHVDLVAGRSQKWLLSALRSVGCRTDLSRTGGVILMGAALCGRHVLVSNLTGYLFLRTPDDALTARNESRREPSPESVPLLVAIRNMSGLAHEWAHSYRAAGQGGRSLSDEPAWVREGLAEVWAGIAIVAAHEGQISYRDWHAVRLRRFLDWPARCTDGLEETRRSSGTVNGCEYFLGPLAIELLVARHGGLRNLVRVFHLHDPEQGFLDDFVEVYGMTLEEFEAEADEYIAAIRRVELGK